MKIVLKITHRKMFSCCFFFVQLLCCFWLSYLCKHPFLALFSTPDRTSLISSHVLPSECFIFSSLPFMLPSLSHPNALCAHGNDYYLWSQFFFFLEFLFIVINVPSISVCVLLWKKKPAGIIQWLFVLLHQTTQILSVSNDLCRLFSLNMLNTSKQSVLLWVCYQSKWKGICCVRWN